ncbi:MAG: protein kinase [Polyangiaceae bacterium]
MESTQPNDALFAGKYRLVKMLGRGAMGEVWLAVEEGPRNFSRQVAVKRLLTTEGMSDIARQSFVAEAQALAHLDHPNIVRLIELGESDDRGLYLVLDYVDGAALDKIMKRTGPMPPATAALIGREVAKALDAVHMLSDETGRNLGVVHRDVSPANILIGRDGRIRLSDFGVARITGLGGEKTETGIFKGKLPYMPPEQALGEPFDGRADLFSLGITVFETLIGGRLRKAETQGQLIARIATERAPYVHERAPDTPPDLARAIDSTTEFKAAQRVPNAGQLALMLHQVLYQLGPRAEEEAINDIRERIAVTTSTTAPQSRPWSLALSSENPMYGAPSYSSASIPSAGSGPHVASGSGSFRVSQAPSSGTGTGPLHPGSLGVTGPHAVTGPHPAAGPQTPISTPPSLSGTHPSVTHISSIADAHPKPKSGPWIWVALAALTGGAVALGLWLFLERGKSAPGPASPSAVVANNGASEPSASTTHAPTSTTTASQAPADSTLVSDASPSSAPSSGKTRPTNPIVPKPVPSPTESAEESTGPGSIQVVCSPWGAVSIDGRSVGVTPIGAVSVPPGTHTVSATNSDLGASRAQTVKVVSGKTAFVKFDFKKAGE